MSDLTRCNWHTLQAMKARAAERGVEVIVTQESEPDDPMRGWVSARFSDQDEPSAWFMQLTEGCAC